MAEIKDVYRYGEFVGKEVKISLDKAMWGDDLIPVIDASAHDVKPSHASMVKQMKEKIAHLTKLLEDERKNSSALLEHLENNFIPLPDGVTSVDDVNNLIIEWNGSKDMHPVLKQDGDVILLPKGCWVVYGDGLKGELKPDWEKAPKEYSWWAVDSNGVSYWYRMKPRLSDETLVPQWYLNERDEGEKVGAPAIKDREGFDMEGIDWKKTLMKRPGWRE